ncbi:MAG TPA: lamin tail domain-containing protein, partial [Herpetosiphonaceae bacterium]
EPDRGWLELYNPQPYLQSIDGWQLDDDDLETPPLVFPTDTTLDAHGFLVVEAADLEALHGNLLRLRRPDGSFADMLSYTSTAPDTTLSRYPVHGGGWQRNTPPTRGTFNQAPPPIATPTSTPTAPPLASPSPAAQAKRPATNKQPASSPQRSDWLSWIKRLLAPLLALSLIAGALVWSRWGYMGANMLDALARRSSEEAALEPQNRFDEQNEEPT